MFCVRYRPPEPRASPVWQDHAADVPGHSPEAAAAGKIHAPPVRPRRRRVAWRELIQQVWGADPLRCPLCSGLLRPIAAVETGAEIAAILAPLGLFRPHDHPFAVGPPRPEVAVLIDAATGDCHALDPPDFPPGLPYPQPRDEPIRFRAEVMKPGESFDQTGFELSPPPPGAPADAGQGELFGDDYSLKWSPIVRQRIEEVKL